MSTAIEKEKNNWKLEPKQKKKPKTNQTNKQTNHGGTCTQQISTVCGKQQSYPGGESSEHAVWNQRVGRVPFPQGKSLFLPFPVSLISLALLGLWLQPSDLCCPGHITAASSGHRLCTSVSHPPYCSLIRTLVIGLKARLGNSRIIFSSQDPSLHLWRSPLKKK